MKKKSYYAIALLLLSFIITVAYSGSSCKQAFNDDNITQPARMTENENKSGEYYQVYRASGIYLVHILYRRKIIWQNKLQIVFSRSFR
ncbi:MAG: hypothetical protein LUH22_04090 [Bacteroides sp.]|nr:hypothetical protein [Bacteroides sp.]